MKRLNKPMPQRETEQPANQSMLHENVILDDIYTRTANYAA